MAPLFGVLLAISVGVFATGLNSDRDRAFYLVVMTAIASFYALSAMMRASTHTLLLVSLVGAVFVAVAASGFRRSLWAVVAALAAHGVLDLTHGLLFTNAGMPVWWPTFCLAYDVPAAAYLVWLHKSGRMRAAV